MSELHPDTGAMLEDIPPYLRGDPGVRTVFDVIARELARVKAVLANILAGVSPITTDDQYGFLTMWERLLDLPEAPSGVSVSDRRDKVLAALQMRNSYSGYDWVGFITQGLGTADWSHQEGPGDYELTVLVPNPEGDFNIGVIERLLAKFTPAHLGINYGYAEGFIISNGISDPDASQIGIDIL